MCVSVYMLKPARIRDYFDAQAPCYKTMARDMLLLASIAVWCASGEATTCGAGGACSSDDVAAMLQLNRMAHAGVCDCGEAPAANRSMESFGSSREIGTVSPAELAKLLSRGGGLSLDAKVSDSEAGCKFCSRCMAPGQCESKPRELPVPGLEERLLQQFEACQEVMPECGDGKTTKNDANIVLKASGSFLEPCNCCKGDGPEQVAIFMADVGEFAAAVWVTWVQRKSDHPAIVKWSAEGLAETTSNGASEAPTQGYAAAPLPFTWASCTLCGGIYHGFFYRVRLENVPYGVPVSYSVGDDGPSATFTLRSPASSSSRVVVVGDGGTRGGDTTYSKLGSLVGHYDALVSLGDFSYSNGFAQVYDDFFRLMQKHGVTTSVPSIVTPGNHENVYAFAAYLDRFLMVPSSLEYQRPGRSFYHQRNGNVHWISLNFENASGFPDWYVPPEHYSPLSEQEFAWLEDTLVGIRENKKAGEWIAVIAHRPLYCTVATCGFLAQVFGKEDCANYRTTACNQTATALRNSKNAAGKTMEELFLEYRVDLVFGAHVHAYERSFPTFQGNIEQAHGDVGEIRPFGDTDPELVVKSAPLFLDPKYPTYITNGGAGNAVEQTDMMFASPSPSWSARRIVTEDCVVVRFGGTKVDSCQNPKRKGGYGVLSANETHLSWAFFSSTGPEVYNDGFVIHRPMEG